MPVYILVIFSFWQDRNHENYDWLFKNASRLFQSLALSKFQIFYRMHLYFPYVLVKTNVQAENFGRTKLRSEFIFSYRGGLDNLFIWLAIVHKHHVYLQ